nr:MAG TPA: hypothetical protein [Caudoviricetes sp.]
MKVKGLNQICNSLIYALENKGLSVKEAKQRFEEYAGFRVSALGKDKLIDTLRAYSNIRSKK